MEKKLPISGAQPQQQAVTAAASKTLGVNPQQHTHGTACIHIQWASMN
jgi:hypothetical protein